MKTVILAGGFRMWITEENAESPTSIMEISEMPILWQIIICIIATVLLILLLETRGSYSIISQSQNF